METERFERLTACPACGGGSLGRWRGGSPGLADLRAEDVRITDSRYGMIYDLDICGGCGHIFANPRPTPAFIDALYGELEDPLYDAEAEGRGRNFGRLLRVLERRLPPPRRILDVGAATGILMNLARERGWRVEGVEPSGWAVRFAREKYGLEIRRGAFEDAPLDDGAYDAVTMIDFIEHTARPAEAVRRAAAVLREGGFLCLVTPDVRSAAARLAGRRWWHFRLAHLAYFSRASLNALLRGAGLEPVLTRRYAWTFSAHYLLSRKRAGAALLRNRRLASFSRRIPIKLALRDSFEIYARKAPTA